MSFADPQSVTIGSDTISLPRIKIGDEYALYRKADGTTALKLSHQSSKNRVRRMVRIDNPKIAADPLNAVNQSVNAGVYIVVDAPANGVYTADELRLMIYALTGWLTASNGAAIPKLLGGES